ncbi:hypothetical protein EV580_1333 [Mycobacterium sp. BK086]|uniref:hypothetical protein n=1 Tax=Mycobacterium sp. BK086 TaxID=2512165 RepID=UPI0010EAC3D2|nr:hypothetical protein [Mycobacterium sp. BK086]TDO18151.1 hypothetical protein EV580_1333 [Mycobacterium sp. BK086]
MTGTTAECSYIGGHAEGFDRECWWCWRATLVDRTKAALEGITPAPWERRTAPHDDTETHAQFMAGTLVGGEQLHVLIAESPDPKYAYIVPAVTGDGPTSERNAEFIAAARTLVPELLSEVERQEQLIAEFRRRDESATGVIERLKAEVEQLKRGGEECGKIIRRQNQDVLDITGLHHLIGEDGDGDWAAVWENLAEMVHAGKARLSQ